MERPATPGWIVVLNGAPRSGKSSIVAAMQEAFAEPWLNLGVDVFVRAVTPARYRPGIGLRPGASAPTSNRWSRRCMPRCTSRSPRTAGSA